MLKCFDCSIDIAEKNKSKRCKKCYLKSTIGIKKNLKISEIDRFCRFFIKTDGCWEWLGNKYSNGYGIFTSMKDGKHAILAHRVSYKLFREQIPEGLNVCHSCDNPGCVRPDHLWLGTQKENVHDMVKKNRCGNQYKRNIC